MAFATASPFALLLFLPSLPPLAEDFGVGLGSVQWIINGFLIAVGTMQLVVGPLVDRLGRRTVALSGLVLLLATSALATFATGIVPLVFARVAQALCLSSLSVVSRAVVQDVFEGTEAGRAMSYITLCFQAPALVAPALGGLLLVIAGWPSLFVLIAVAAAVLLFLAIRLLPETRPAGVPSAASSVGSVLADYRRLVANPRFSANAAIGALSAGAALTLLTILPSALTDLFAKSPDVVGYYTSAYSLVSIAGALAAARLVGWLGMRRLVLGVLTIVSLFVAVCLIGLQLFAVSVTSLFAAACVVGFSQSIIVSMSFARAVQADDELRGMASGLAGASSSIVSAMFAAAGAGLYASGLTSSMAVVLACFGFSLAIGGLEAWRGHVQPGRMREGEA